MKSKGEVNAIEDINKITSAYARNNTNNFINSSPILWINPDKKRTTDWMYSFGLQLPSATSNKGSSIDNSITQESPAVNSNIRENSKKDTKDDKNNMKDNEEKTNGGNTDGRFERNSDRGYGDVGRRNRRDNGERIERNGDNNRGIQEDETTGEIQTLERDGRFKETQGTKKLIKITNKNILAFVNQLNEEFMTDKMKIYKK